MVKRTDKRTSHGNECMGDFNTGEKCKLSLVRKGKPKIVSTVAILLSNAQPRGNESTRLGTLKE